MSLRDDIIAKMKPEDFPRQDLVEAARIIGVPALVSLLQAMPGTGLYLSRHWSKAVLLRMVREFYDGSNSHELAVALGVSRRQIQVTLNRKTKRVGPPNPDQMKLV